MTNNNPTIFAPATASGRSGVAVIRISGPKALSVLEKLTDKSFEPRQAVLAKIKNPKQGDIIDHALCLYFKAPHSFTGEDVVEFHIHGSPAVMRSLIEILGGFEGCRMAGAGEFSKRAFENGKMDLTETEAIADLIHAETEMQRKQALRQMSGVLGTLYNDWTERLKKMLAYIEAEIEFPDEDLPDDIVEKVTPDIDLLLSEITSHLNDNHRGERLREGIRIAIFGAPNAGKSSLLNRLAQRDVAIVTDEAGTTRDVIEVALDIAGYPVILSDTAGLRMKALSEKDKVEAEGIKRALAVTEQADLKIALFDGTLAPDFDQETLDLIDSETMVVWNKSDLYPKPDDQDVLYLSAETGEGIKDLLNILEERIKSLYELQTAPSLTRERHRFALEDTKQCLDQAKKAPLPELLAEDVRLAIRSLGTITGKVGVEDLLDVIFRDFCIGK